MFAAFLVFFFLHRHCDSFDLSCFTRGKEKEAHSTPRHVSCGGDRPMAEQRRGKCDSKPRPARLARPANVSRVTTCFFFFSQRREVGLASVNRKLPATRCLAGTFTDGVKEHNVPVAVILAEPVPRQQVKTRLRFARGVAQAHRMASVTSRLTSATLAWLPLD